MTPATELTELEVRDLAMQLATQLPPHRGNAMRVLAELQRVAEFRFRSAEDDQPALRSAEVRDFTSFGGKPRGSPK